jgi:predicted DNA-binding transcriptional regulator AlpA
MKFAGRVLPKKQGEKYYSVTIQDLGIYTQGKDHEDAINMAKDALEELLGIDIEVSLFGKNDFAVTSSDLKPLIGRFLETLREESGLTIRQVTEKLGKKSPNFYAQYEQGKSLPSMEMISDFIKVISPDKEAVITLKKVC